MAIAGRSIAVAQGVAVISGILGAVLVHEVLLRVGVRPLVAFCGVALAMSAPLSAWLGVATVPEALTASLVVTSTLCLAARDARPWGAVAILVASLSRYEAWPVAIVFAAVCAGSAIRRGSNLGREALTPPGPPLPRSEGEGGEGALPLARPWRERGLGGEGFLDAASCVVALAGPAAWILWNAHAHGNALHFLARVTTYRARVMSSAIPAGSMLYPEALVRSGPLALAVALAGAPGLIVDRNLRKRWAWPLAAMLAIVVFLVEGDLHNGAPTHHPERALVAVFWMGTLFGVDGACSLGAWFSRGPAKLLPPGPPEELLAPGPLAELLPPGPPPRKRGGGDVNHDACEPSHAPPALPARRGAGGVESRAAGEVESLGGNDRLSRRPHPVRNALAVGLAVAAAVVWMLMWPSRVADFPGRGAEEDRTMQLARGTELRLRGVEHLTVTPCAYEHFAVIAAFGAPERVTVAPQTGGAVTADCPRMEER